MAKKQKSYFLSIDEGRELKRQGVERPAASIKRRERVDKVVKEKTGILTARVAVSSLERLKSTCQPSEIYVLEEDTDGNILAFKQSPAVGYFVEEALLTWFAIKFIRVKKLVLFCSKDSYEKNKSVLKKWERKRRGVKPDSETYKAYGKERKYGYDVFVNFGRFRPTEFEKRMSELLEFIRMADLGIYSLEDWPPKNSQTKKRSTTPG